jgi:hypothetical protein
MQSIGPLAGMAQNGAMRDEKSARVLVRRPSTIKTEGDGRAEEGSEVELVSTQILKQILSSKDSKNRQAVEAVAKTAGEGVLARNPVTGYFEIIDDDELQEIIDSDQDLPKLTRPSDVTAEPLHDYADSDHLSMVSTEALRRVLDDDDEEEESEPADVEVGEFNPYCA